MSIKFHKGRTNDIIYRQAASPVWAARVKLPTGPVCRELLRSTWKSAGEITRITTDYACNFKSDSSREEVNSYGRERFVTRTAGLARIRSLVQTSFFYSLFNFVSLHFHLSFSFSLAFNFLLFLFISFSFFPLCRLFSSTFSFSFLTFVSSLYSLLSSFLDSRLRWCKVKVTR